MSKSFEQDVIDLLSGKRGGHVQKYMYSDTVRPDRSTGASLWHEFVTANKNYYTIRREIELIPQLIQRLDKDFDTIIDFGIGDEMAIDNKTAHIIRSQLIALLYAAIDQSNDELTHGLESIARKTGVQTRGIQGDFYNRHYIEGRKKLGLCLGGTITNQDMRVGDQLPYNQIVQRIKTLGQTVQGEVESSLILSIDTNPDLDAALAAYQHIAWVRMQTGFMYDIQARLKPEGDFRPSMWHYEPVIDRENYAVQQVVSPSVNQDFFIGDQEFNVRKGDQFVLLNNFKFPQDLSIQMVEAAGLEYKKKPVSSNDHPLIMLEASVA